MTSKPSRTVPAGSPRHGRAGDARILPPPRALLKGRVALARPEMVG